MIRTRLLGLAIVCLLAAAWMAPPAGRASESVATSIGRSMGGLRVLVVDILFLRANALVDSGRAEDLAEAQQLYRTVLELDPGNDAAHVFLVDMYVSQMLPLSTTAEARFEWWVAGWDLAHRGLDLGPRSAPLHLRIAQMLIDSRVSPVVWIQELRPQIIELVPDREHQILRHLLEAIRITDNIPNRGRIHLHDLAVQGLSIAVDALRDGDEALFREALAACTELLVRREETLKQMDARVADSPSGEAQYVSRWNLLALGQQVLGKCHGALRVGDRARAQRYVAAYEGISGPSRFSNSLWALVGKP